MQEKFCRTEASIEEAMAGARLVARQETAATEATLESRTMPLLQIVLTGQSVPRRSFGEKDGLHCICYCVLLPLQLVHRRQIRLSPIDFAIRRASRFTS
jgi:hypothetical protein